MRRAKKCSKVNYNLKAFFSLILCHDEKIVDFVKFCLIFLLVFVLLMLLSLISIEVAMIAREVKEMLVTIESLQHSNMLGLLLKAHIILLENG